MQEILNRPAKLLTQAQREAYFADGFVGVEGLVDARWLERLNKVTNEFIEVSKDYSSARKDKRFDLEPDHSAENPRLRRLNSPVDHHETYWDFASTGPLLT